MASSRALFSITCDLLEEHLVPRGRFIMYPAGAVKPVTFITGGRMSLFFRAGRATDEVAILASCRNIELRKKTSAIICGRPL